MRLVKTFLLWLVLAAPTAALAESFLLMAEEEGCYWCRKWNAEIAPIYPMTPEGQAFPLRRYDLRGPAPDVQLSREVHFTPTFILVEDGREVGRIEGYPGEDFFWGLLDQMIDQAGLRRKTTG